MTSDGFGNAKAARDRSTLTVAVTPRTSLLDCILGRLPSPSGQSGHAASATWSQVLQHWLSQFVEDGPDLRQSIRDDLARAVAEVDRLLAVQTNAILHHPQLQKLEATWRGLAYLIEQVEQA